MSQSALLTVNGLTIAYQTLNGRLNALDNVNFSISQGEALALVGESGSGKSTIALATMGLLGPEADIAGSISFEGRDLAHLPAERAAEYTRPGYQPRLPGSLHFAQP